MTQPAHVTLCKRPSLLSSLFATTMALLPVGTVFLLNVLAKLLAPPVSVYAAFSLYKSTTNTQLHQGLVWTCVALAYPLLSFIRKKHAAFLQHREMSSMGAVEVPSWKGKWPGNIDLLLKVIEQTKSDYIGESQFIHQRLCFELTS